MKTSALRLLALCVVTAGTFTLWDLPARAQTAIDEAARAVRQIEGQQSEQERLRQLEQLQRSNRAPGGELPAPPAPVTSAKGERCFKITTIKVDGAKIINSDTIRATVSEWEGRCLGLAEINSVLKALTFLYVEKGYVASRAYLSQQDLSHGVLAIAIVEGKLEDIRLNGQADGRATTATAFPGMVGAPVNLRDVEQGLDQINRLRSNDATIALAAGKEPGSSVLDVTNKASAPVHVTFGSDNLGVRATGIYQSRVDLAFDDILGVNDFWSIGYQRSMDRSPTFFTKARPNSDTVNASMSVPYGYWTFGIDNTWSQYHSSVPGQISAINTDGASVLVSPYASWVIHRDQISKTSITGRMTWKDNDNEILGSRIDVASRMLSIAAIELNHSRQLWGGQASASLGVQRGLDVLGAFNDATAPVGSPKGQFTKVTASLGYYRPFDLGPVTAIYNTYVLGQWAPERLFGSEQMALGGYSTVRGVREAILFADNGAMTRNEFSLLLPAIQQADIAAIIGRIEPYVAVDVGYAAPIANGQSIGGTLAGAAIGLRNRGGRFAFDVFYADLLSKPADISSASLPPTRLVQGRMSISF